MAKAQVSAAGDVAELVISAPPLNLFDGQLITDLEAALDELDALIRTRAARAVLLRAEGKVFCAGVDVHEFQGLGPAQGAVLMARFLALVQTLEQLPVRDHGVAAADAVTAREVGQIFATRDLPAGLESLLEQGPNRAIFEGR